MAGQIAVVGPKDAVLAFRALGVTVAPAQEPEAVSQAIFRLAKEGYAVIFVTEEEAEGAREMIARFELMQKVGMTAEEIRSSVRSQVLTVFFFPLVMAGVHIVFAFKMIAMLMSLLQLTNTTLFALTTVVCFFAFAAVYALIYAITARSYYRIVS